MEEMEELRDLNELAKTVVNRFNKNFNANDCRIPQAFKDKVQTLKSFSVVYNDYSVIIKGDGIRSKDSYIPNQSFYMASFFIEYSHELSKYKQKIMPWITGTGISANELTAFLTHERDNGTEDIQKGKDKFIKILDSIEYHGKDRNYLIRFVTDYNWWFGSKTIDRSDFFNSPVLNIMGLTASSNAAMALIVDHLTQHPELNELLLNQVENTNNSNMNSDSYQRIFYGAPGTGKSNTIKREVDEQHKTNFRVTFHPDSDYSTFVGCYKPKMKSIEHEYSLEDLVAKLNEIKISGVPYPVHKFSALYWKSLSKLTSTQQKQIIKACDFSESMVMELYKGLAVGEELSSISSEEKIIYEFVPQAFTKAYTAAWNTTEDVYLIIEEINRGNCAQIFGDLFQLLDRKDGFSEYPVDADSDLADHIRKELAQSQRTDIPKDVKEGTKLVLPSNLYIWATMNTSDQSLFPIDSAFKRRWDWMYVPIANAEKGWKIDVDGNKYDWWSFLSNVNNLIETATNSEDKKLGYFFCKADNGVINAETFVSKVVFYLWNDVFKDFPDEAGDVFKDTDGSVLSFNKFYYVSNGVTKVKTDKVELMLKNLKVDNENNTIEIEDIENSADLSSDKNYLKEILFPDGTVINTSTGIFNAFMNAIQKIGVERVGEVADSLKYRRRNCPLISKTIYDDVDGKDGYSYVQMDGCYFLKGAKTYTYVRILEDLNGFLNVGMTIRNR